MPEATEDIDPLNKPFAVASVLTFAMLAVHVTAGAHEILTPVMASDAAPVVREVVRACWHMISLVLLGSALAFGYCARRDSRPLAVAATALAGGVAIVFAVVSAQSGLGMTEIPQWTGFLAIAVSGAAGLRVAARRPMPTPHRGHALRTD